MPLFPPAVQEAQAALTSRLRAMRAPEELVASFTAARLPRDAVAVDDIVARLARAEIEGHALGRYGGIKFFPALGDFAKTQLAKAHTDSVRTAIAKSVGVGYVFLGASEVADVRIPEREPREIWNVWAPGLNSGLIEQTALPPDMISDMRMEGASIFQADALALGLGGFRKKARLQRLGGYYAQAGAILRALQTHPERLKPDPTNQWEYDDYPP